jgi:hypothetical protein
MHWHQSSKNHFLPFRFEKLWLTHPEFMPMIKNWWSSTHPLGFSKMYRFQQKLKLLKQHLKIWNKSTFGNIFLAKKIWSKKWNLFSCKSSMMGALTSNKEAKLQSQIEDQCMQEEILWKQKSRISWLKEGERNTSFFHHSTIQHIMHNRISCLKKHMDPD